MRRTLRSCMKNKISSFFERALFKTAEKSIILCYLSTVFIVFLVALDVTLRRFLNRPLVFSYELVGLAFIPLIWASILYSTFKEDHIRVDIFFNSFPSKLKRKLYLLFNLSGGFIFILIGIQSISYALRELIMNHVSEMLEIPYFPFILLCAIGALLSGIVLFFRLT